MQWKDVHSQSWPMTPDQSQFGYTPTYLQRPLLARPFGAPLGVTEPAETMAGRGRKARRRRAKKRARSLAVGGVGVVAAPFAATVGVGFAAARLAKKRRATRRRRRKAARARARRAAARVEGNMRTQEWLDARAMSEGMSGGLLNSGGLTVAELTEMSMILEEKREFGSLTTAQTRRLAELQAKQAASASKTVTTTKSSAPASAATASASASAAVPIWRADRAEVVPSGRDPETYFRSLGFSRGDARRLAEHARVYPDQRGERRRMMDRFAAPMERRMNRQASGGGGFDASGVARGVGDLFGGLFGRREQAQAVDYGGGGGVAAEPARQGMSPLLIGGLAVAGLGAAYFLTQA